MPDPEKQKESPMKPADVRKLSSDDLKGEATRLRRELFEKNFMKIVSLATEVI